MEITLHPKQQFQQFYVKERDEWRDSAQKRSTQMAFTHALAHLSACGCTPDQLMGAQKFALVLLNLGEPEPPPLEERYPAQPLHEPPAKTHDQEQTTET